MSTLKIPKGTPQERKEYFIKAGSQVFNSTDFAAFITVTGIDPNTGEVFTNHFKLTEADPEIVKFFNDYTTRLIAERNDEEFREGNTNLGHGK